MSARFEGPGRGTRRAPTPARWAGVVLGGVAGLVLPVAGSGQEAGSLVGSVYDAEALRPLEGVSVELSGSGQRATTDAGGVFRFEGVPAGALTVRLALEGYVSLVERVEITPSEVALLQLPLQRVGAVLDELLVLAGEGRPRGHAEGEVRDQGDGTLTAADLLTRGIPGVTVSRSSGVMGGGLRVRLRGSSSISLSDQPAVYLDGVRIDEGGDVDLRVLDQIRATDVLRIRVLRGPAAASRYPLSAAGVLLIETRRGEPPG